MPPGAQEKTEQLPGLSLSTVALSLVLAVCILLAGVLMAQGVRRQGEHIAAAPVFGSWSQHLPQEEKRLLQQRTVNLVRDYLFAFADAAIRFEAVPKLDTGAVYTLAAALPQGVEAVGLRFEGYDLVVECTGQEEELEELVWSLSQSGYFRQVLSTQPEEEQGMYRAWITCRPLPVGGVHPQAG